MSETSRQDNIGSWYDQAPCGLLITDPNGIIVDANDTIVVWTGYRRESLVGQRSFADLLSAGGRIYHETHYSPTLRMQGSAREIAVDIVCADGHRLPVLVNASVEYDEHTGEPRWNRVALFAATQRRQYERELLAAKQRAETSETNARLLARTLQQTLLPHEIPAIPGLDVAAVYRPAGDGSEVGGDFYDVFQLNVDSWIIAIGDVQGKGVDAAIVTAIARNTFRAAAIEHERPSEMLHSLNEVLLRYRTQRYRTAVVIRCRRVGTSWHLTTGLAGHPPPLLARPPAPPAEIAPPGILAGCFTDATFHDTETILQPDDAILVYTDGVTEARRNGEVFGEQRTRNALQRHANQPAHQIATALLNEVLEFQHGTPRDDIAIIALRPATPQSRRAIRLPK